MRRLRLTATALAALSTPCLALAQAAAPSAPPSSPSAPATPGPGVATSAPAPTPPSPDTVIAKVGPDVIRYADLESAIQQLPEQLRALPPQMVYPMLLDRLIDQQIIVLEAKKEKLQDDPAVQQAIARATDMALQNALLTRDIQPLLTPDAIKARYDAEYANKQGEPEVKAAHILVASEQKAKDIIAQLQKGADFTKLAQANSTDPSAKENNGELGWFKKGDMLPEFSAAAFALKPGQITTTPVKTQFGWHVIKVEDTRTAPPPTIDEVRDQIRQQIIQQGVAKVLADAKQGVTVQKFNPDGTPMQEPAAGAAPGMTAPGATPGAAPGATPGATPTPGQ